MAKAHAAHKPPVRRQKRPSVRHIDVSVNKEPPPPPKPKPAAKAEPKSKAYTHEDWQKEVAKHVSPGQPIPDWLAQKAP